MCKYLNICYIAAELGNISADIAISNMEIHQNTGFMRHRDVIWTNGACSVIVNLDFSPYEQTIAKLMVYLFHIQEYKTSLAPVHELCDPLATSHEMDRLRPAVPPGQLNSL